MTNRPINIIKHQKTFYEKSKHYFQECPWVMTDILTSALVDTMFVDIYVDTKNIPTCRYNIQHINKRRMEK